VLRIEGPDTLSREKIDIGALAPNWADELSITQGIGDNWLREKRSLLLEVPSVLVPETWNTLVNPLHPEASLLKVTGIFEHAFDSRLF